MDWLLEIRDSLEEGVFDSLVLDFVTEDEDEPVARGVNGMPLTSEDTDDDEGKRSRRLLPGGRSKDCRDDLPQFIIGDGRDYGRDPHPGLVQAREHERRRLDPAGQGDMRDCCLSKVVIWVADGGFTLKENRC